MSTATVQLAEPGIYDRIAAEDYHADPCMQPSLSASLAHVLCSQSPRHAWTAHPRLNPKFQREAEEKFDLGTAAHDILLGGGEAVVVVNANDWRTNAAKEARDGARAIGKVALLAHQMSAVMKMVQAVREQLDAHRDGCAMFRGGDAEQTVIWQEPDFGGIWCRARFDYQRGACLDDLKTTSASANPDDWTRTLFNIGADIQTAFYLRGLKAVTGFDGAMRYAVVENYPPFAMSVIDLSPAAMVLGQKKVLYALELFSRCLQLGNWPAYPPVTCSADVPAYIESAWIEKELR